MLSEQIVLYIYKIKMEVWGTFLGKNEYEFFICYARVIWIASKA